MTDWREKGPEIEAARRALQAVEASLADTGRGDLYTICRRYLRIDDMRVALDMADDELRGFVAELLYVNKGNPAPSTYTRVFSCRPADD